MYQIGTYFLYVYHSLSSLFNKKLDISSQVGSGTNHFAGIHLLGKIALCDEQNLPKSDRYGKHLQKKPASLRAKKHEKIM